MDTDTRVALKEYALWLEGLKRNAYLQNKMYPNSVGPGDVPGEGVMFNVAFGTGIFTALEELYRRFPDLQGEVEREIENYKDPETGVIQPCYYDRFGNLF